MDGAGLGGSVEAEVWELLADNEAVADETVYLVAAAMRGDDEFADQLGGDAPPPEQPRAETTGAPPPLRAFLRSITVSGFRGIGGRATLEVNPYRGITVISGRNGSGKSSFAEALEQLLTGRTYRWGAGRTKVWKEGWRNLHHKPAAVEAEILLEGEKGVATVRQAWADEAALEDGRGELQVHGKAKADPGSLGWEGPLETYRPFLSYNELGSLLEVGPSKLFDALAQILGLEALTAAEKALAEERKARERPLKDAEQGRQEQLARLATVEDSRAKSLHAVLDKKKWSAEEADAILASGGEAPPDSESGILARLALLQAPGQEQAAALASALRQAHARTEAAAGTLAKKSKDLAELLDLALAFHDAHGDQDCPVCGNAGALDEDWHASRARDAARLKQVAAEATEAQGQADAARRQAGRLRLQQEIPGVPALEEARRRALEARDEWNAGLDAGDPEALAAHLEEKREKVESAFAALRALALAEQKRREDAWMPVAEPVRQWLAGAKAARQAAEPIARLKAAEGWLKDAHEALRNERFLPIKEKAQQVWNRLRMQSHVDLQDIRLAGSSTRRQVELDVNVDGVAGAALGVMSQGELHALALSLFLPRATLPESPFRFLVIDDPVQSMDPARVDGLAQVLHETARDRQVVVFTHDDRLPEAVRRLQIPATVVEVTRREQSAVETRLAKDPVSRYLEDAFAVARAAEDGLPEKAARRVVPGLCRLAIDAACTEVVRRRRLARGDRHGEVEEALGAVSGSKALAALALFDDEKRTGEVLPRLNAVKREHADVFRAVNEGSHEELRSAEMFDVVRRTERLARWISELK